ncbi:uncharacterized protein L203_105315 [Cryptococcus depauperatus CBS 7841]|uniref:Uncharacterized protein n=1 Tax=Cryptococcus depauperatus CBS 7841 TaxID=1295531 RepID=A0AAJ8JX76_9TREE
MNWPPGSDPDNSFLEPLRLPSPALVYPSDTPAENTWRDTAMEIIRTLRIDYDKDCEHLPADSIMAADVKTIGTSLQILEEASEIRDKEEMRGFTDTLLEYANTAVSRLSEHKDFTWHGPFGRWIERLDRLDHVLNQAETEEQSAVETSRSVEWM